MEEFDPGSLSTGGGDFIGRDKHIHGDEVHGDKTVNIYPGPTFSRLNYRSEVAGIIDFYTETFVGREIETERITQFIQQEDPGYLLIEAPAGFGKSALIAHLIHDHEIGAWFSQSQLMLIYFYIRQEGGRNTPEAFLQAVNFQLLDLLDLPGGVPTDLSALRNQFSELWSHARSSAKPDQPLLLFVDGLDESHEGEVDIADLLPADLGPHSHVIVSSRPNPRPLEQVSLTHPNSGMVHISTEIG